MRTLAYKLVNVLAVLIVVALLLVAVSDIWMQQYPETPLPWGNQITNMKTALGDQLPNVLTTGFMDMTERMGEFANRCGAPSVCVNKIVSIVESASATFLVAAYTWIGIDIIERLEPLKQ